MQLPLNVSPVSASFFGLERLGIHRVLSVACSLLLLPISLSYLLPFLSSSLSSFLFHASSSWVRAGSSAHVPRGYHPFELGAPPAQHAGGPRPDRRHGWL